MKTLALALTLMLLSLTASHAGPNEGVVLGVQGNVDGVETNGEPWIHIPYPQTCAELVPTATPDAYGVEWFLVVAVLESDPLEISTFAFGLGEFDPVVLYIGAFGPTFTNLSPLEISTEGWPGPQEGTAVTVGSCICYPETNVVPVYYFGVYAYAPGTIPLGPFGFPDPAVFTVVDCFCGGEQPIEDPIEDWGIMGCGGAEGFNPCEPPTPTEQTTWGQIKAIYR